MASDTDKQICSILVILTSISFGALGLTIMASIVLLICKPKVNVNLLNRLMEEEMKKLMGNASYGYTPPQEPEVETPKKDKVKKPDKDLKN